MAHTVEQIWHPNFHAMGPRRARRGGRYLAFVPDLLVDHPFHLDARIVADLSDAERAIIELDRQAVPPSPDDGPAVLPHRLDVLARVLLRAEAVGSSQIEGLVVSPQRLERLRFSADPDRSGGAGEVLGNIEALQEALELATVPGPFTVEQLCQVHHTLLQRGGLAHLGGLVRQEQNWIGGLTPVQAAFVPPPPTEVPRLLHDLCAYVSNDAHSPLMQAALAHAQFETVHPFADGNGRTGRALLQLVLRRRGLCHHFVPPISLVLATWSDPYIEALMGTRTTDPAALAAGWSSWVELVAAAAQAACRHTRRYGLALDELREEWRARVSTTHGHLRSDAAVWRLLDHLPAIPMLDATLARQVTGRSQRPVDQALAQLVEAGVIKQVRSGQRYRVYETPDVFRLITTTERALASPRGDTQQAPPNRPVPILMPE